MAQEGGPLDKEPDGKQMVTPPVLLMVLIWGACLQGWGAEGGGEAGADGGHGSKSAP